MESQLTAEQYRQILINEYKNQELSVADFENTLKFYAIKFARELINDHYEYEEFMKKMKSETHIF